MKRIVCLVLFVLLLVGAAYADGNSVNQTCYVKTNGGHLNVRSWPDTDANILGQLDYGQRITVTGYVENNSWARINYYGATGYVLARYLSYSRPVIRPTAVPYVTPTPGTPAADTIQQMNTEYDTMQVVNSFQVTVHPSRIGGWVNLRWGPSLQISVLRYCYEGEVLTVVAQNATWYQVFDANGRVGFIMRSYCY